MTIWVFNQPPERYVEPVSRSVKEGVARFGWSWLDGADLNLLKKKKKSWKEMSEDEKKVWGKSRFLLDIKPNDWVVYVNVPKYGICTTARVVAPYSFDSSPAEDFQEDFRHCVGVDKDSVLQFDRNDPNVHPAISRRLKLRGRYWRIYDEEEFFASLERILDGEVWLDGEGKGEYYLKRDISEPLRRITELIHRSHPGKDLEKLMAKVFGKVPGVESVVENGSGWGTDYGADLIVEYRSGLPIDGLEKIEKLVVQIKSYAGDHKETIAVNQLEEAFKKYDDLSAGVLITTAEPTGELQEAIEKLSSRIKKPISLLAGKDVASFVLRYFGNELLK